MPGAQAASEARWSGYGRPPQNIKRDPRSYPHDGQLWRLIKKASDRRTQVSKHQRLYTVNERIWHRTHAGKVPDCGLNASEATQPDVDYEKLARERRKARDKPLPLPAGYYGSKPREVKTKAASKFEGSLATDDNTRLHFGAAIALQAHSGIGAFCVKSQASSREDGTILATKNIGPKDVVLFKLLELEEPGSHKACRFGDAVWLQICGGPGEPSWRHGSVVGAKVIGACNLPTVPVDSTQSEYIEGDYDETVSLGAPAPIRAMLPTGKEAMSFHEMRHRNKAALTLGRWRLLPATDDVARKAAERGGFVCNGDLVYLEQDFFHVTHDRNGRTSLERVPKKAEDPGYNVERTGCWVLRVATLTNENMKELSYSEQRGELLLQKAIKSMRCSHANRMGRRGYDRDADEPVLLKKGDDAPRLPGGKLFCTLLRHVVMEREALEEEKVLAPHAEKEAHPHNYFASRFPTCGPPVIALDERSIVKLQPEHAKERKPQVQRNKPVHTFLTEGSVSSPLRGPSVATFKTVETTRSECPSLIYGPEWHVPKHDLLINKHTTQSSICPFDRGTHDVATYSEVTQEPSCSLDQISRVQKRKADLLGKAKSWAYDLGGEDRFVNDIACDESLTSKMRCALLADTGEGSTLNDDLSSVASRRLSRSSNVSLGSRSRAGSLDTLEESSSGEDDEGHVYDPDDDDKRDVEKEALTAIDSYFSLWQAQLNSQEKRDLSSSLLREDQFLAHNIDYLKRRERFKHMFSQLKIQNARIEESSSLMQDMADEGEKPLVDALETLKTFDEVASLKHFEASDLMRDMLSATVEAYRKFVLPALALSMKDGSTKKMAEAACEACLVVAAFSERVVAPRCTAFAHALKAYLMEAAGLKHKVKDEDLPLVISDLAAPHLDPDVLRRHAKKFYSEVDLFCTHATDAYLRQRRRSTRRRRRTTTRVRRQAPAPLGAPAPAPPEGAA